MAEETDIVEAAIVLIGKFNPAIFSPAWFAKNGVISDGELEAAETVAVHPQISRFVVEHLTVNVEPEKMSVSVTTEPTIRILDMILQLFRDLLPHTPVTAFGINYAEHWRLDDWRRRVALGRALAPPEPWGAWGERLESDDPETVAGLIQLVLLEPYKDAPGARRVDVGPSTEIADKHRGVYVKVNHHRDVDLKEADGAIPAVRLIEEEFDSAIKASKGIINDLRAYAEKLEIK
jgi:hypothetical protein